MVVLGDIAAPRDRGKYYGYFSATYTTAGACGPALGGFIAEYLHWSIIFWLNIPLGLIAIVLTLTLLRRLPRRERRHSLDFLGAGLIMTASVAFMLGLSLGGVRYAWSDPAILGLFAVALVIGTGFVVRLLTATEPLIPLSILSDRVARLAIVMNAFGWGPIVGLNIFLPMYLQTIKGFSATAAGLSVLALSALLNTSAGVTGSILPRLRHYKLMPMALMVVSIGAVLTLAWQGEHFSFWQFECVLALIGIGFGAMPPLAATVLQNSVSMHNFGTAISTMQFCRNLYCTILISVFGAMVLVATGGADSGAPVVTYSADGFVRLFYAAAGSFGVALIAMALLEEKPLAGTHT
jgi:MFS family permease